MIPPSLRIRPSVDTVRGREMAERASRQFLNERLRIANFKCRELQDELKWREIGLRRTLDQEDFGKLKQISEKQAEKIFSRRGKNNAGEIRQVLGQKEGWKRSNSRGRKHNKHVGYSIFQSTV